MPYARKSGKISRKRTSRKGTYRRNYRRSNTGYRKLSKRISAVSRRVAGEVCKFESTPFDYKNSLVVVGTSSTQQSPLMTITSGNPWIMPLNWIYQQVAGVATSPVYIDGQQRVAGESITASFKNPLWYNTVSSQTDNGSAISGEEILSDVYP